MSDPRVVRYRDTVAAQRRDLDELGCFVAERTARLTLFGLTIERIDYRPAEGRVEIDFSGEGRQFAAYGYDPHEIVELMVEPPAISAFDA